MNKSKYVVVEELDPSSVTDISTLQMQHYLNLGYRPYLMGDGSTKWLTEAQRVYKESKAINRISVKKPTPMKINGMVRKRRGGNRFVRFVRRHWLIILLVIIAILIVLFALKP